MVQWASLWICKNVSWWKVCKRGLLAHRLCTFWILPKWPVQFTLSSAIFHQFTLSSADAYLLPLNIAMIDIIKLWRFSQNDMWKMSFNLCSHPYYWSWASFHIFVDYVMIWLKPAAKSECIVGNNLVGGWDLPTPQQGTFFGHVIPYPYSDCRNPRQSLVISLPKC